MIDTNLTLPTYIPSSKDGQVKEKNLINYNYTFM